jgi:hypothetical protein
LTLSARSEGGSPSILRHEITPREKLETSGEGTSSFFHRSFIIVVIAIVSNSPSLDGWMDGWMSRRTSPFRRPTFIAD